MENLIFDSLMLVFIQYLKRFPKNLVLFLGREAYEKPRIMYACPILQNHMTILLMPQHCRT